MNAYVRCPYCGQSDGNDDPILEEKMCKVFHCGHDLELVQTKLCDICGRKYKVKQVYKFLYKELLYED